MLSTTGIQVCALVLTQMCVLVAPGPPRWRAYTSSSYYYTDYSFPKPQSKLKFVPGPQYCPDTGRTICKGVRNYPDDHIYQLVSSSKARRFNFTSVFMDEREGDVEPNNALLPEGPPNVQHDGYVVYQTAVHYDYHLPNGAATWRYAPVNAQTTVHRRRRPLIRRRQLGSEEKAACSSRTRFLPPQAALNDNSEWKYIVNVQNKDPRFRQIIKWICASPLASLAPERSPCRSATQASASRSSSRRSSWHWTPTDKGRLSRTSSYPRVVCVS
ncbi:hypothetical protein JTE90_004404 [Oedothorax gibbosus]|uniref:Uncharacterized protein n=1 Tax=Oedothorax gibbosus TaxID=931172 RepID=A0AAV6UNP4_9ARAC|nr:hypothetical protein JTE90_004404 [Oedothorax gibbosus]